QLGGKPVPWKAPPWSIGKEALIAAMKPGPSHLQTFNSCGQLTLAFQGTVDDLEATTNVLGALMASPNQATIRKGAPLFWSDGQPAGQAGLMLAFTASKAHPGPQGAVCHKLTFTGGEQWPKVPGYLNTPITICTQPGDVSTPQGVELYTKPTPPPPPKADPRVAQVLADPKAKPTQGTTTPPTDARSLVSLARRYAKARKALQTTLTTTLTSQEPQALPSALKKVLAIHNDYIQALKVVPEPAEKLHVALMLADIQWNIALDLAQSPTPNTLNAEQADTYRAIMSQDVIKPSLLRALATYRGARTIARKHALSLPPLVTVRIAVLEVLETPEP
ncbi:MAG: hypothetical protein AAFS10_18885, partial [Myxococcota bacterium]